MCENEEATKHKTAFVKMFSWVYLGFVWKTIRGSSILLVQQSGYWWTSRRCSTFRAAADGTSRWFTRCWSFQRLTSSLIVIFNQFKALPNIITGWCVEAKVMANSHFHRDRRLWKLMECTSNLGTFFKKCQRICKYLFCAHSRGV